MSFPEICQKPYNEMNVDTITTYHTKWLHNEAVVEVDSQEEDSDEKCGIPMDDRIVCKMIVDTLIEDDNINCKTVVDKFNKCICDGVRNSISLSFIQFVAYVSKKI
ncbi:uncharacterized protein [Argopecten irradians]|uniref:uncharacterized protein n=1 Tax=Argopecten irradians TaxID=31199 RepID=UPI00371FD37B